MKKLINIFLILSLMLAFAVSACAQDFQRNYQLTQHQKTQIERAEKLLASIGPQSEPVGTKKLITIFEYEDGMKKRKQNLYRTQDVIFSAYTVYVCGDDRILKDKDAQNTFCKPAMDYVAENHKDILAELPSDRDVMDIFLWDTLSAHGISKFKDAGYEIEGETLVFSKSPFSLKNLISGKVARIMKDNKFKEFIESSDEKEKDKILRLFASLLFLEHALF